MTRTDNEGRNKEAGTVRVNKEERQDKEETRERQSYKARVRERKDKNTTMERRQVSVCVCVERVGKVETDMSGYAELSDCRASREGGKSQKDPLEPQSKPEEDPGWDESRREQSGCTKEQSR